MRLLFAFVSFFISSPAHAITFDNGIYCVRDAKHATTLHLQIATSQQQLSHGLMHRKSLALYDGMLFKFSSSQNVSMWMKDTPLSLDMIFVDDFGKILAITRNTVPYSEKIISSPAPVRSVIELKARSAKTQQISIGAIITSGACSPRS